ncbi:beta-ketoacyl-ACP synthase [Nostoc sp. CENA67]|uniref:Beta-ketoacyl-ACP synthase n=1 Tax=Amazonocrinis nigriterrae CENA67 TaxID=2794033 RepID=A0A8J7HW34_9NOST|nr:beta-ketoacyl-ACP synthase [Amazonocrinis nigriterrae]MBH8566952.1 beta-ketoacyl-ACP synthase [Amazonocrinis nigriterrae CENA67]
MIKVVVTGIGLISSLGASLENSWQKLIAGESGIKWHQPFPELEPLPLGLIGKQPTKLTILTESVVASALKDAGLVPPLPDCAVIIGSSRSHQASWESLARQMYSLEKEEEKLENWLDTLPHMNAIAAARQIGANGIVLTPMAACATGIWAIAQAAFLVQTGQCQTAIAGAVEAPITPLTIAGFQQMGALAKTGAYPFDLHREGLVLGEGAAVFVLESAELARQRQAKIYGEVLGFGLTTDAYHPNQPEPQGKSAIAAVEQCLKRSCLTSADIDYIHAHGTATQLNDSIESMVIQQLFTYKVAVSSTKGATGHTLGASGALGIAFSLQALQQKFIPPCVGLQKPEFDLDLVMTTRQRQIQRALCFSFGFGGQNAVVALGKDNG